MNRRMTDNSAFTLLELLVALALMGVLAGALYASLHIAFSARTRAEAAIAPVRAASLALELVRRDIVSTPPPTGVLAGSFVGVDAKSDAPAHGTAGDADTLDFYSAVSDATHDGPVIQGIELAFVPDASGRGGVLVRRLTSNLLAPVTQEPVEETLCRNVLSFNLTYYDGMAWTDSWDSTTRENALPVAVEATLTIRNPDPARGADATYTQTRMFLIPCGTASTSATTVAAASAEGGARP